MLMLYIFFIQGGHIHRYHRWSVSIGKLPIECQWQCWYVTSLTRVCVCTYCMRLCIEGIWELELADFGCKNPLASSPVRYGLTAIHFWVVLVRLYWTVVLLTPFYHQASRKHLCTNPRVRGKDNLDEKWCIFLSKASFLSLFAFSS